MAGSKKCFTFFWKIKNFSFCSQNIESPPFLAHEMGGTKWVLSVFPFSGSYPGCVAFYVQRVVDNCGPDQFELDFELAFIDGDGFVLKSETFLKKMFNKGETLWDSGLYEKNEEIGLLKKDVFIPDDILTIRCRMWDSRKLLTQSGRCFAETCIETENRNFIGVIKNFSSITPSSKNLVCFKSSSTTPFLSSINLGVATDGKLVVELKLANQNSSYLYRYQIFIRDISGITVKSGEGEFRNSKTCTVFLSHLKEYLIEKKSNYLSNDVLTIECEVTFPNGQTTEKVDEPEYGFDFEDTQMTTDTMNISPNKNTSENLTTLMDDMTSLLNESILYDTKLITGTETFPAHKLVLSARSSVFKSMFSTDMKEKTNNCVNIDDLDADTVRQMLLFMYSDKLEDLNYESAKSLYFAADKYNIFSLRYKCSSVLKQKLSESNCCDLLLLADKHQDTDLKDAVQVYIAANDKIVLFSDEWKSLEKNHPQLIIEVLRTIYIKSRRI